MEQESGKFVDWINNLTIADVSNLSLMLVFTIFIIILVVRTFRNKSSV